MHSILQKMGEESLDRMKQSPSFPFKTGFLRDHSRVEAEGDNLVFHFDSPYSAKLAKGTLHNQFGNSLILADQELLQQALKQAYLHHLKENIDGSLSNS